MQSRLFENALTDVTGKIRLESEDPRWIQLFSSKSRDRILEGFDLSWFGNRLVEHNIYTGNLNQLLVQTRNRLHQVVVRHAPPPAQLVEQCCTALHLSTIMLHFVISTLTPQAIRNQLNMADPRSAGHDLHHIRDSFDMPRNGNASGAPVDSQSEDEVDSLLAELSLAIDSPLEHTWMRDIRFFCVGMLLVMCGTQLYAASNGEAMRGEGAMGARCFNSEADVFMNRLFSRGEGQLRAALGSSQSTSVTFDNCMAVQLVRGLARNGLYSGRTASDQPVLRPAPVGMAPVPPSSILLQKLVSQHTGDSDGKVISTSATEDGLVGSGAGPLVRLRRLSAGGAEVSGALTLLLWGIFLYLPMTALQGLFRRMPDSSQSSGSGGSTSTAPSSSPAQRYAQQASARRTSLSAQQTPPADPVDLLPVAVAVPGSQRLAADPVPERCLHLLLILLHNRRSGTVPSRPNPFREAFCLLHDLAVRSHHPGCGDSGGDDLEGGQGGDSSAATDSTSLWSAAQPLMQGQGGRASAASASSVSMFHASRIHISLPGVISGLCRNLPTQDSSALVLYSLLQGHPTFTESLINAGSLAAVFSSCLEGLYLLTAKPVRRTDGGLFPAEQKSATTKNLNHLYVLVVCVLMLVQDSAVLHELTHRAPPVPMSWYSERQIAHATAMDAALLCLLRVSMCAVFRVHDQYLLSNTCAILHNLSSRLVQDVLPYTAERLVKVLCQLCGKAVKHHERSCAEAAPESGQLIPEALSALLQMVDAALSPERVAQNVHLLYAVMLDAHSVEQLLTHAAVESALKSQGLSRHVALRVVTASQHYLALLDARTAAAEDSNSSAAQTVEWLLDEMKKGRTHVRRETSAGHGECSAANSSGTLSAESLVSTSSGSSPQSHGQSHRQRRFTYQEAANAEEFFLPCIWTSVLRSAPEIPWDLLQLTLVDPLVAGLLHRVPQDDTGRDSTSTENFGDFV